MTDPHAPAPDPFGDLPPDLPPEYAEAYRRGYQRAWATSHGEPAPDTSAPSEPASESIPKPLPEPQPEPWVDAWSGQQPDPLPSLEDELFGVAQPASWTEPAFVESDEPVGQPRWLVPALVSAVLLALVLAAYGVGTLFSGADDAAEVSAGKPSTSKSGGSPDGSPTAERDPVEGDAWDGPVRPLSDVQGASSCVLGPSTDAAGRRVTYGPGKALDGDFTTAWRCAGDGVGVTLRLTFPETVRLAEVGLVPGYAKTDPASGVDRYAENNRVTRVRWTFPDGRSVVQELDPAPGDRRLQTLRIPPVKTDRVTVEVLDSVPGPRNTVAFSEIQLSETLR